MTSTITSSIGPTLNGMALPRPFDGFSVRVSAHRPFSKARVGGRPSSERSTTRCCAAPPMTIPAVRRMSTACSRRASTWWPAIAALLELGEHLERRPRAVAAHRRHQLVDVRVGGVDADRHGQREQHRREGGGVLLLVAGEALRAGSLRAAQRPVRGGRVRERAELLDRSTAVSTRPASVRAAA